MVHFDCTPSVSDPSSSVPKSLGDSSFRSTLATTAIVDEAEIGEPAVNQWGTASGFPS